MVCDNIWILVHMKRQTDTVVESADDEGSCFVGDELHRPYPDQLELVGIVEQIENSRN